MELPVFPLHVVLFPGRPLPLHLFEARYRQMLRDCLDADRRFGVIAIRRGREVADTPEVFDVGTVAEIQSVNERADGCFDITARGVERFRLRALTNGRPYLTAEVDPLPEPPPTAVDLLRARRLRSLLVPYLSLLGAPSELLERVPTTPRDLAYLAASALQIDIPAQQQLLEVATTGERLHTILGMLRREANLMRHLGCVASLRPAGPGGPELN